ncbi:MAG: hypothetical protein SAMD01599839_25040 [Rectinema sp.]
MDKGRIHGIFIFGKERNREPGFSPKKKSYPVILSKLPSYPTYRIRSNILLILNQNVDKISTF